MAEKIEGHPDGPRGPPSVPFQHNVSAWWRWKPRERPAVWSTKSPASPVSEISPNFRNKRTERAESSGGSGHRRAPSPGEGDMASKPHCSVVQDCWFWGFFSSFHAQ